MAAEPGRWGLLALATTLAACGGGSGGDADTAKRAVEASTARYITASRSRDAHALAQLYAEHAVLMPPDEEPVEGRDAIEAFWRDGLEPGIELRTTTTEASGGVAYAIGRWSLPATADAAADSGKLVLCWKREGRQWKLVADIWNSSLSSDSADDAEPPRERVPVS